MTQVALTLMWLLSALCHLLPLALRNCPQDLAGKLYHCSEAGMKLSTHTKPGDEHTFLHPPVPCASFDDTHGKCWAFDETWGTFGCSNTVQVSCCRIATTHRTMGSQNHGHFQNMVSWDEYQTRPKVEAFLRIVLHLLLSPFSDPLLHHLSFHRQQKNKADSSCCWSLTRWHRRCSRKP